MRVTYTKKVQLYDEHTQYWAEYNWNSTEKTWVCRDGGASEGFFYEHPTIPRTMSDHQMTLLAIKG